MRKIISIGIIFLVLMQAGCVERKVATKVVKTSLSYNIGSMPQDLIMDGDSDTQEKDILVALFEGLVKADSKGKVIPGIAESWSVSKDGLQYIFKLRSSAFWSNGDKITSKDITDFFTWILKDEDKNIYAPELFCIFGAEAYYKGNIGFDGVAITAPDPETIQFKLNQPTSDFLEVLSQPVFNIREKYFLKDWQKNLNLIKSSGPYVISSVKKAEIDIKKNTYYWDATEVKEDNISLITDENSESSLASFETGNSDIMINPPYNELAQLKADKVITISGNQILTAITFNLSKKGILSDLNFRTALNNDINRSNIINGLYDCDGIKQALFSKNLDSYKASDKKLSSTEMEKASSNSLEAYKGATINLALVYLDTAENKKIVLAFIKEFNNVATKLNLKLNLTSQGYTEKDLKGIISNGSYDLILMDYNKEYESPFSLLYMFTSKSSFNIGHYSNPLYDNSFNKGVLSGSAEDSQNILIGDLPFLPLYIHSNEICKNENVGGVSFNAGGNILLDKLTLAN